MYSDDGIERTKTVARSVRSVMNHDKCKLKESGRVMQI